MLCNIPGLYSPKRIKLSKNLDQSLQNKAEDSLIFYLKFDPFYCKALRVLFSPMASKWVGGWADNGTQFVSAVSQNCKV